MKVDYYHPPHDVRGAAAAAERAARLGFDGFFTAETAHDPFIPLATAGDAAPTLELGTAIAVAFPRSPMVMAQVAWDLADRSGGRFILGLGTQVRAHMTRRFSVEWVSPTARLEEYIASLRTIWRTFQTGDRLRYEGDHYRFTLMTPFFDPGPIEHPDIPIAIAGVNAHLTRLAGRAADGFHLHPFHTIRYLDEVVLPNLEQGAASAGRDRGDVEIIGTIFVGTGRTESEVASRREAIRKQIAFYASTPSYRVILETHGWEVGPELSSRSRRGDWDGMAELISDEMLDEVAVVAPFDELGHRIARRFDGRVQRIGYYFIGDDDPYADEAPWPDVITATRG